MEAGSCGICQRPKNVEDCSKLQLRASRHDILHRGMKSLRKQKPDAHLINRAAQPIDRHLNIPPQSFPHTRPPAETAGSSFSVFSNVHTCAGGHEGSGCENVERTGSPPAGPGCIEYRLRFTVPKRLCSL